MYLLPTYTTGAGECGYLPIINAMLWFSYTYIEVFVHGSSLGEYLHLFLFFFFNVYYFYFRKIRNRTLFGTSDQHINQNESKTM